MYDKYKMQVVPRFRLDSGESALQLVARGPSIVQAVGQISTQTSVLAHQSPCFIISSEGSASGTLLRALVRPV